MDSTLSEVVCNNFLQYKSLFRKKSLRLFCRPNTFDIIGYPLLNWINMSLERGEVPQILKASIIIPVPKVKYEFRPINMLSSCDKILEVIVYNQLIEYIDNNNIMSKFQSGFKSKHSCETALQFVINEWKLQLDAGKCVGLLFLDLKRAFETIDRKI